METPPEGDWFCPAHTGRRSRGKDLVALAAEFQDRWPYRRTDDRPADEAPRRAGSRIRKELRDEKGEYDPDNEWDR